MCRHVRKAAVQLLSTAAHNKPALIVDHLASVLPLLYDQTSLNPALVRYVPERHSWTSKACIGKLQIADLQILCMLAISFAQHYKRMSIGAAYKWCMLAVLWFYQIIMYASTMSVLSVLSMVTYACQLCCYCQLLTIFWSLLITVQPSLLQAWIACASANVIC